MSGKRKASDKDTSQPLSGNQRKKQRLDAARTIHVQFAVPASSSAQLAESSTSQSNTPLPSSIDVEKFVEARSFEINAMQTAMETAQSGATHRVWQTLPRHLRRRAASHDVRRVPSRLREKARAEMDMPKKSTRKKLPQLGKEKRVKRTDAFLKRQVDKTWLETHLWHAKRMHMENMWGYRLSVTPTEKSFRPSHRASLHGCILHDASYESVIELKGPEEALRKVLNDVSDPQIAGPGAPRYTSGSRICKTHIYKAKSYPFNLVGPVDILWRPIFEQAPRGSGKSAAKKNSKGSKNAAPQAQASTRVLWIRCHPLMYEDVLMELKYVVQIYLRDAKATEKNSVEIEVADLRDQFNVFQLIGPKSSQVIHGALKPIKHDDRPEFNEFWSSLGQLQAAGSAPRGMAIGFKVLDPRLEFPPKNTKIGENKELPNTQLPSGLWPTAKLARSDLWDEAARDNLSKPRFKKKDIDERKSKHLVPGSSLNPLRQDDRIPVLLIQTSVEVPETSSPHSKLNIRPLHGWTLIIPKGWGMPFFSSLTHTGTRVGGQRERESQFFEAGCAFFPRDHPCTTGHDTFWTDVGAKEKEIWEKKPPAKRSSWTKLGTHSPWKPDWDGVLGLKSANSEDGDTLPTQRDNVMDIAEANPAPLVPWLLRGAAVKEAVEYLTHSSQPAKDLLAKLNEWRGKRGWGNLSTSQDDMLKSALVQVKIDIPCSGSPEDNAIIYSAPDEEAKRWRALIDNEEQGLSEEELGQEACSQDFIIGYVTSGRYSLSIGRGQGIGSISFSKFLDLKEQCHRLGKPTSQPLVKVRNKGSTICRAAVIELAN